jgi:hypothetical protein
MRCGFNVPSWLTLTNDGTTIASGILRFVPDGMMTLVSSAPNYNSSSGDTLFYNYSNLYPGQSIVVLLVYEMPLTPGLELCINSFASIFDGTVYQPATENLLCDTITCSFDPNDKAVIPPGVQAAHYILKTDSLLYTIRFQNEGNDTAFTVALRDQLSGFLDRNTLELVASSHPVTLSINASNLAEFRFENILLPWKAIDETGSQGFVQFRIVPIQGLPDGTVIENDAGIYFDFNPPVITNLTHVTLVTTIPVGIGEVGSSSGITVQPQPFSDRCEIILSGDQHGTAAYSIFTISGRHIHSGLTPPGKRKTIQLDTSLWQKGVYFIRINGDVVRLVKY